MSTKYSKLAGLAATVATAALILSACAAQNAGSGDPTNGGGLSGPVVADGSSTVEPLTSAAAELYRDIEPGVQVTVATSGTGGGFEVFCAGESDMQNASRAIAEDDMAACAENGVEYT